MSGTIPLMKNILLGALFLLGAFAMPLPTLSQTVDDTVLVHMFGREDCKFCQAEKTFLAENGIVYEYLNVVEDKEASELFNQVAEKHEISKVTPLTIIGDEVIQGYNSDEITGERILAAREAALASDIRSVEDHIARSPKQVVTAGSGCDENGVTCNVEGEEAYIFDLPWLGVVNLKDFSLFSLSLVLGVIDGFNPCAMWVLVTFLVLLSQAGSRKKMVVLAGLFIAAEAIMYNLILNVWYKTWDFIALDQVVTPLVGLLALGGGSFFLYRWYKNRKVALVCDISSIDSQNRTLDALKKVINQPLTLFSIAAIIAIAFSVNIIEFACSIGIPQAYTKVLELNALSFLSQQFYIMVYTVGYMIDDFVVFGLAIWGYSSLEAHGHKYSQLSLLIGGALMLVLGLIMVLNPQLLVL